MKKVGFIPARYDSSRFPGKPLALIAGKPMIRHVYERALSCPDLTEVWVATDDERIFSAVIGFEGKALMTGKAHCSGTDRVFEAASKIGLDEDDIVVNIQGDQPAFNPSVISQLVNILLDDKSIPMATLMWKVTAENPLKSPSDVTVVTDSRGFALYFSRSPIPFCREAEPGHAYYKHLGFYGYRMSFLSQFARLSEGALESIEKLEMLRALEHGYQIKVLETPFDSVEVDSPEHIQKVEGMIRV
ncbi:MAG: 3-deoxy-manno-octulosonate cytidylyltransferase [Desulfatiglans sp.]|jgi:3-deoxy-manno-octulosonate cytidylyltransferase (CMP-KDO synthetase)|nr:3-deoxy-manno-octulosonate cytidylyltransferase [Thermodesulfobacteriota bacterium]MEE4352398.1 3-deoxy-manno-octulosonate cytidylyltransferase [Desulfatiglans sp.]